MPILKDHQREANTANLLQAHAARRAHRNNTARAAFDRTATKTFTPEYQRSLIQGIDCSIVGAAR